MKAIEQYFVYDHSNESSTFMWLCLFFNILLASIFHFFFVWHPRAPHSENNVNFRFFYCRFLEMTHQNVKMFSLADTFSFSFTPSGRVIRVSLATWCFETISSIYQILEHHAKIATELNLQFPLLKILGNILYSLMHNHSPFKINLNRPLPPTNNVHALLTPLPGYASFVKGRSRSESKVCDLE